MDRRRQPARLAPRPRPLAVEQVLEEQRVAGRSLEDPIRQLVRQRRRRRELGRHPPRVLRSAADGG